MTTSGKDAVRAVFDLYNSMTSDLAIEHGNAAFSGVAVEDGWDKLPGQVSAAQAQLDALAHSKSSRREHRHARAVSQALGVLHDALVERAAAQTNYLTMEASVKKAMDEGSSGNLARLDLARSRIDKANQRMIDDQSTLLYDLENLDADLKS